MTTIIIDDVAAHRIGLSKQLSTYSSIELVGEADSIRSGYDIILQKKPELVFLDIELSRGNGFDLLDKLLAVNQINFEVIFITGWDNRSYPIQAIEYSALSFLEKPIREDKLQKAVERAMEKITDKRQYEMLLLRVKNPPNPNVETAPAFKHKKMAFQRARGAVEEVFIPDILYLETDEGLTKVYLTNETFTAYKSLGFYERLLIPDYNFLRIHDKRLLNLDYLKRYEHINNKHYITLTNDIIVEASRRGYDDLKKRRNTL